MKFGALDREDSRPDNAGINLGGSQGNKEEMWPLPFEGPWELWTLPYESWKMLMFIFTCAEEDCRRKEDCRKDVSVVHCESSLGQDYNWCTV